MEEEEYEEYEEEFDDVPQRVIGNALSSPCNPEDKMNSLLGFSGGRGIDISEKIKRMLE